MSRILISVIIVNRNGKRWLKDCFDSLIGQTFKDFEIIFVDNNSSDDSIDYLKSNYKLNNLIIVKNDDNLGFGIGNNIGAKNANGEYLLFLNNDTKFDNDVIERLYKCITNTKINIISPLLYDSQFNHIGNVGIDFLGYPGKTDKPFYIEGCSLMISKKDFDRLGMFDEKYFMYSEDVDLCWRARLYGMSLGICNDAKLIHYGGGSTTSTRIEHPDYIIPKYRRYEVEKNNLRNILKNYNIVNLFWVVPFYFIQNIAESFYYLFTLNFGMFGIIYKAIWWNIKNLKDTLQQRNVIQSNRVVADSQILGQMIFSLNKIKVFLQIGRPKFK